MPSAGKHVCPDSPDSAHNRYQRLRHGAERAGAVPRRHARSRSAVSRGPRCAGRAREQRTACRVLPPRACSIPDGEGGLLAGGRRTRCAPRALGRLSRVRPLSGGPDAECSHPDELDSARGTRRLGQQSHDSPRVPLPAGRRVRFLDGCARGRRRRAFRLCRADVRLDRARRTGPTRALASEPR